jgi:tripartite-type tricarboxylate transporter receptor subunit TctC
MTMTLVRVVVVLAMIMALPANAQSTAPATYPSRPVKILVPFAPGGATDTVARLIGEQLSKRTGQPYVVENRTGAGGIIAIEAVVKSPADGYTLLVASASYAVNPAIMKLPFDPVGDLAPVVDICFGPLVFLVNPEVPVHTLGELVAYAKANPGKLTYASAGIGNTTHIGMEAFLADTQTNMVHSPYKGMAPALSDVAGGHAQVILSDLGSAMGLITSGKLRALAIGGASRLPALPNVPTVREAGYPDILAGAWQGMFAPRDVPPAVLADINRQVNEILQQKDMIEQLATRYQTPIGGSASDFATTVRKDIERFGVIARNAGLKPE